MKKLITLALTTALTLSAVSAVDLEHTFPSQNTYPGYADVKDNDWFASPAKTCYETGLMIGTDQGFQPLGKLTIAELAALAARIRSGLTGETIPAPQAGQGWYQSYLDYLSAALGQGNSGDYATVAAKLATPTARATRWDLLTFFALAVEGSEGTLEAINQITALPDVDSPLVLRFYNAGILTGTDRWGTFDAEKTLTRAETASMAARIIRPALRQSFTPADYSLFPAAYMTPSTLLFSNGITAADFLPAVNEAIAHWEQTLGEEFNWHADIGDGTTVLQDVERRALAAVKAEEKNATQDYRDFDYQVYYSRLLDRTGTPLQ